MQEQTSTKEDGQLVRRIRSALLDLANVRRRSSRALDDPGIDIVIIDARRARDLLRDLQLAGESDAGGPARGDSPRDPTRGGTHFHEVVELWIVVLVMIAVAIARVVN